MKKKEFENNKTPMAVLVTFNHETKEMLYTEFEGRGAYFQASGLWESIKDDWPECSHVIYRNKKAAKDMTDKMLGINR